MTSAAARAALGGPQPPVAQPTRLAFVDIEDAPRMIATLGTDGMPVGHDPALGLTDQMADRLREVCDIVDSTRCEANGCENGLVTATGESPAPVGWLLAGEADERTEWAPLALVQRGERVVVVCRDCSPSTVYDRLWEMG